MKVELDKVHPKLGKPSAECQQLIDKILSCSRTSLTNVLSSTPPSSVVKLLSHSLLSDWAPVLDGFDGFLARVTARDNEKEWDLRLEKSFEMKELVKEILKFLSLLLEHCQGCSVFNMTDRMLVLLESSDMIIVYWTLHVLYLAGRRSSTFAVLPEPLKDAVIGRVNRIASSWQGDAYGLTLADYCSQNLEFPAAATKVTFELELDKNGKWISKGSVRSAEQCLLFQNVHSMSVSSIMNEVISMDHGIPKEKLFALCHNIRSAHAMGTYEGRRQSVNVLIMALSAMAYIQNAKPVVELVTANFIEECFELMKQEDPSLFLIKRDLLIMLAAILSHDRNILIPQIGLSSGAAYYHGFLPTLTRACVKQLIGKESDVGDVHYPPEFIVSLFSFLYQLAMNASGAQYLVQGGIIDSLFMIVSSKVGGAQLNFVTRAVRIIDAISRFDSFSFQNMDGMYLFIHRLAVEIERSRRDLHLKNVFDVDLLADEIDGDSPMDATLSEKDIQSSELFCMRRSLMKCLVGFINNAIQDSIYTELIRHIMDGNFYYCLQHIIENRKCYGHSLFLLSVDVVASFIQHEPSQLSTLQSRGLTNLILTALCDKETLIKNVFNISSTLFSSLCLNEAGTTEFLNCGILNSYVFVLIDSKYTRLARRKSLGTTDSAAALGSCIEVLGRQQSRLVQPVVGAIIDVITRLREMCYNAQYACESMDEVNACKLNRWKKTHTGSDFVYDEEIMPIKLKPSPDDLEDEFEECRMVNDQEEENPTVYPLWDMLMSVIKFLESFLHHRPGDQKVTLFVESHGFKLLFSTICSPKLPYAWYSPRIPTWLSKCLMHTVDFTRKTTVIGQLIQELLSNSLANTMQLLKSACKLENNKSVLLDVMPDDWMQSDKLDLSFVRPLYGTCTMLAILQEFLQEICASTQAEVRNMVTMELIGSRLIPSINLLQRGLHWESVLISAVQLPKDNNMGESKSGSGSPGSKNEDQTYVAKKALDSIRWGVNMLIATVDRLMSFIVSLSVGAVIRGGRITSYVRTNPPHNGNLLLNAAVIGGHQGFTSVTTEHMLKVPANEWITFTKLLLTSYQRVFFGEGDRMLHSVMVKANDLRAFSNLLYLFNFIVSTDQLWTSAASLDCLPQLTELLRDYLCIIQNILITLVIVDREEIHERPIVCFAQELSTSITRKLYPTILALWRRVVNEYRLDHFTYNTLFSIICHMVLRDPRPKEANTTEDAVEDVEMTDEIERYVNPAVLQNLLDMGFGREMAIDALLSTDNVVQAADYCIARSKSQLSHNAMALLNSDDVPTDEYSVILRREVILDGALQLLGTHPSLVYRLADLLSVTIKSCSYETLLPTFHKIRDTALLAIDDLRSELSRQMSRSAYEKAMHGCAGRTLYLQLHLMCLLMEEFRAPMATCFFGSPHNLLHRLTDLMEFALPYMEKYCADLWKQNTNHANATPSWVCTYILAVELAERETTALQWSNQLVKYTDVVWYYFDRKWVAFDPHISRRIHAAFVACERQLRILIGGRRQIVDFGKMMVTNIDMTNERFVMFLPVLTTSKDDNVQTRAVLPPFNQRFKGAVYGVVDDSLRERIFSICIHLICPKVKSDTLHAVLRLCLRYTRHHEKAVEFMNRGGVERLLNIRTCQSFTSLYAIVTVIVRHILEDKETLKYMAKQAMRKTYVNTMKQGSPAEPKDFNYVMRSYEQLACRDMDVFIDAVQNLFRLKASYPPANENESTATRWNSPLLNIRLVADDQQKCPPLTKAAEKVISILLNYLFCDSVGRSSWTATEEEMDAVPSSGAESSAGGQADKSVGCPPVYKSAVLYLLAELIFNFPKVASFVIKYRYIEPGNVRWSTSVLAHIFDNLIIGELVPSDRECNAAVRMFVNSFADSKNGQILTTVVCEIKDALRRVLLDPALSSHKHKRLTALAQVVMTLKSTCSEVDDAEDQGERTCTSALVKAIQSCKLLQDLADVIHYLSLTDPQTIVTVNSILGPLEEVARHLFGSRSNFRANFRVRLPHGQHFPHILAAPQAFLATHVLDTGEHFRMLAAGPAIAAVPSTNTAREPTNSVPSAVTTSELTTPDNSQRADVSIIDIASQDDTFTEEDDEDDEDDDDEVMAGENTMAHLYDMEIDEDGDEEDGEEDDEEEEEEEDDEEPEDGDMEEEEVEDQDGDEHEADGTDVPTDVISVTADEEQEIEDVGDVRFVELASFDTSAEVPAFLDRMEHLQHVIAASAGVTLEIPSRRLVNSGFTGLAPVRFARSYHGRLSRPAFSGNAVPVGYVHPLLIRHARSPANGLIYSGQSHIAASARGRQQDSAPAFLHNLNVSDFAIPRGGGRRSDRDSNASRHAAGHAHEARYRGSGTSDVQVTFPEVDTMVRSHGVITDSLSRWISEGYMLDGIYVSVAFTAARMPILEVLGKYYDEEMEELKRQAEEEEERRRLSQATSVTAEPSDHPVEAMQTADVITEGNNEVEPSSTLSGAGQTRIADTATSQEVTNGEDLNSRMGELLAAITETVNDDDEVPATVGVEVFNDAMSSRVRDVTVQQTPGDVFVPSVEEQEVADIGSLSTPEVTTSVTVAEVEDHGTVVQETTTEPVSGEQPAGEPTEERPPTVPMVIGQRITDPQLLAVLGDVELPEGVDPMFLAELPDEIRQEVVAEQVQLLRNQRQRLQATAANSAAATHADDGEISAEFLVALPPELQAEVLTQQRLARQHVQRRQLGATDNQLEFANFFDTIPRDLREQILADVDESQLVDLPQDLVEESRRLRENRAARLNDSLLASWTNLTRGNRYTNGRGALMRPSTRTRWRHLNTPTFLVTSDLLPPQADRPTSSSTSVKCFALLDKESLSCLLVTYFCNDKIPHVNRLHRVLKLVSYDSGTRDWLIRSLISILKRAERSVVEWQSQTNVGQPLNNGQVVSVRAIECSPQRWLQVTGSDCVGCRFEIFQHQRISTRRVSCSGNAIILNPLILERVCHDVLTSLSTIAKSFSASFFPDWVFNKKEGGRSSKSHAQAELTDFWEILAKLDSTSIVGHPGKAAAVHGHRTYGIPEACHYHTMEESLFGQLMLMIKHPIISKHTVLMDMLLSLLSTIAGALPSVKIDKVNNEAVFLKEQLQCLIDMYSQCRNSDASRPDLDNLLIKCAVYLNPETQQCIFAMLQDAIIALSFELSNELMKLNSELDKVGEVNEQQPQQPGPSSTAVSSVHGKGVLIDRFTGSSVVVSGPVSKSVRVLPAKELHCPSIMKISVKNSTQMCLLRTINLFLHLKKRVLQDSTADDQGSANGRHRGRQQRAEDQTSRPADDAPTAESGAPSSAQASEANLSKAEVKKSLEDICSTIKEHVVWEILSTCLSALAGIPDPYTVLVLQPAVEAFVALHADSTVEMSELGVLMHSCRPEADAPMDTSQTYLPTDNSTVPVTESSLFAQPGWQQLSASVKKFVRFAEKHRTVFNQILRQSKQSLSSGPFRVLVNYTRILDFDIKRKYFRRELDQRNQLGRGEDVAIRVRRDNLFQNSYRELYRLRSNQWKNHFYVVFDGEEGQDAGGLLREWFSVITREIFNPNYALFMTSPGDRVTYMINPASYVNRNHLEYFHFIGRLIAKAVNDNMYMDCYFTRAFYKHILGKAVKYTDLESEDPSFYQSLVYLLENPVSQLGYDLTFSLEVEEFGVRDVRELKENGKNIVVTDQNKHEYVNLVCQMKMTGAIRQQLNAFLDGFYDIIPKELISIFDEQELELLISGLPIIDVDDLQQNTEYHKYTKESMHIQWFWRAVRSFDAADRAKLLQFVTGTSRVPLQGFASLQGMNGIQRFQIHRDERSLDRLPTAHTCFNQLDLPPYESYDKLRQMLLLAIHECSEGFGFA